MTFGDFDPEDGWDIGDTVARQIRNLADRIAALDGGPPAAGLDDTADRLAAWNRLHTGTAGRSAHIRAGLLSHDLAFVRSRL